LADLLRSHGIWRAVIRPGSRPIQRQREGQPKYLTLYEFEHAKVPESEAWTRARASNPWTRRMQPNLRHDEGSPGVYQRIYPK
jgi:hypothetical protein